MSDVLLLYLFTRVDAMLLAAIIILIVGIAGSFMYWSETLNSPPRWLLAVVICAGLSVVFVPSQKSLAIIIGGSFVLDAARSDEAKEIGGLVLDAVRRTLKESE